MATNIKIGVKDLGTLCICAIRYCHGRRTYMPSMVQGIVRPLLGKLEDRDIAVMLKDCKFQETMHLYGDEQIDKPGWLIWKEELEAEINRRSSDA